MVFEKKEGVSSDEVLDQAIEAGATDVDTEEDGRIVVETEPTQVSAVSQQLSETLGLNVESADIVYDPKEDTLVSVKDENMAELEGLVALIEDDPSVQDVYTNIA